MLGVISAAMIAVYLLKKKKVAGAKSLRRF